LHAECIFFHLKIIMFFRNIYFILIESIHNWNVTVKHTGTKIISIFCEFLNVEKRNFVANER
jgi:hypothetical protein